MYWRIFFIGLAMALILAFALPVKTASSPRLDLASQVLKRAATGKDFEASFLRATKANASQILPFSTDLGSGFLLKSRDGRGALSPKGASYWVSARYLITKDRGIYSLAFEGRKTPLVFLTQHSSLLFLAPEGAVFYDPLYAELTGVSPIGQKLWSWSLPTPLTAYSKPLSGRFSLGLLGGRAAFFSVQKGFLFESLLGSSPAPIVYALQQNKNMKKLLVVSGAGKARNLELFSLLPGKVGSLQVSRLVSSSALSVGSSALALYDRQAALIGVSDSIVGLDIALGHFWSVPLPLGMTVSSFQLISPHYGLASLSSANGPSLWVIDLDHHRVLRKLSFKKGSQLTVIAGGHFGVITGDVLESGVLYAP